MSRMTPAYVAGLIDGEGCISIYESKGRTFYHSVTVGMTAKALPILEQLKSKYGGNLTMHRKATERWDAAHTWSVHGDLATAVLEEVVPHLVLKEEQARIALKVAEIRASLPARWTKPDADQRARKWTEEASDRCAILKRRMHELNAKGPSEPTTSSLAGKSPIARLVAGVWVTDQSDLLSDLGWEQFRGTWPKSGSMRTGRLYPRPAWEPPTSVSVGSVLPTHRASRGASSTETVALLSPDAPLLPTPVADHSRGLAQPGTDFQSLPNVVIALLPTPAVNDMGAAYTPETWDEWTATMKAKHNNGNGHGKSLNVEAQRVNNGASHGRSDCDSDCVSEHAADWISRDPRRDSGNRSAADRAWGDYAAAIRRWERVLGRPAPAPTQASSKGNPQLSPRFVEWMMGLPVGWVTDVPGIKCNEALKALGNGVVPQQAAEALRVMAIWGEVAA